MDSRPFDYDPFSGTRSTFHWDDVEKKFYIEDKQDVEALVDHTKMNFNRHDGRQRWLDNLNHVASIPPVVYADLKKQGIVDDPARFKKWLNDPDNRAFRTRPGRI